jgi:hypothetical protein
MRCRCAAQGLRGCTRCLSAESLSTFFARWPALRLRGLVHRCSRLGPKHGPASMGAPSASGCLATTAASGLREPVGIERAKSFRHP